MILHILIYQGGIFLIILKYLLLGIIQGLTEPLPISSSAHMIFLNHYLGFEEISLETEVFVNTASFFAIFLFFIKDIIILTKCTIKRQTNHYLNGTYTKKLIIATIPCVVVGLFVKDIIDEYFMSFFTSSVCLIITSLVLVYSAIKLKKKNCVNEDITYQSAISIGILQSVALIPGLSRSGLTLSGGLSHNISLNKTLQFSFFLYLIASFGALVLTLFKTDFKHQAVLPTFIACAAAFVTTSISIRWFYKKLNLTKIIFFSIYCFLIGIINLSIYFFN